VATSPAWAAVVARASRALARNLFMAVSVGIRPFCDADVFSAFQSMWKRFHESLVDHVGHGNHGKLYVASECNAD
jgi:hypothetical protein